MRDVRQQLNRMFTQRNSLSPGGSRPGPVYQLKRDITEIGQDEIESHDRGDNPEVEEPPDVRKAINTNYEASLASGRKLEKALNWSDYASGKAPVPVTSQATENSVITRDYKDFWKIDGPNVTVYTHRGQSVSGQTSRKIEECSDVGEGFRDDQDFMYSNTFNTLTGEFHTSINYKNLDDDVAKKEHLPPSLSNSEIIWHQYQWAIRVMPKPEPKPEPKRSTLQIGKRRPPPVSPASGVNAQPPRLERITRNQIANRRTLDTIFLCDGGAKAQAGKEVTITDGTDQDAWALLGTPNGNSAVWLLLQHSHESRAMDIASVTYGQDKLDIKFKFD